MSERHQNQGDGTRVFMPRPPAAPAAYRSPQRPGQTPDRISVPGQTGIAPTPLSGPALRPISQYGTAQELASMLPAPDEPADATAFEQAPAAFQEQRKAYPWQLPPVRPVPWFSLGQGVSPEPPALPSSDLAALAETTIEG